MRLSVIIIFLLSFFCVQAQKDDTQNQLALLYYSKADYERAAEIYESLFKETHSRVHFDYLISCYRNLSHFDKAESITLEQIKLYPHNYFYQISLAGLYHETNRNKEADAVLKKVERKAFRSEYETIEVIQAFLQLHMFGYASTFISEAKKKFPESLDISKALSDLYLKSGQYKELIQEYITLVQFEPDELEYVQNQLQFVLYEQKTQELNAFFKQEIHAVLEKKSHTIVLQELLLWAYIQEHDLQSAFVISRSLDIREKGQGERIFSLGKIALSNSDYEIATKCFTYVLSNGISSPFYVVALKSLLETAEKQLFSQKNILRNQLQELQNKYIDAFQTLGKSNQTVDVARALAQLQAFYLDQSSAAKQLLEEFLQIPGVSQFEKAQCEILLADILLFEDDVWLANLLYAKIALQYKNNDIGHEAQFKQAKLAYFNSQFEYALALLDVLKASSTKLISNDALELAQLISENIVNDPEGVVLSLFSRADLRIYQKKYDDAYLLFDTIITNYPGHSIQEFILYRKALVAKEKGNTEQEIAYLLEIITNHPHDILAHKAHFMLASYYDSLENYKDEARKHYEAIIMQYPTSFYLQQARKRYRELVEQ